MNKKTPPPNPDLPGKNHGKSSGFSEENAREMKGKFSKIIQYFFKSVEDER